MSSNPTIDQIIRHLSQHQVGLLTDCLPNEQGKLMGDIRITAVQRGGIDPFYSVTERVSFEEGIRKIYSEFLTCAKWREK